MNRELVAIFEYLEKEKGIQRSVIIEALEDSLTAAAQKSIRGPANVTVHVHPKTGEIEAYCEKKIVQTVKIPSQEVSLEAAKEIDPDCSLDQFIDILVTPGELGRIAAQKARQIITQKLRDAERNVIYEEYRHRTNELVSGSVKRFIRGSTIIVDLGKVEAVLPARFYPKTEHYQVGERILTLLLGVQENEYGREEVLLTRSHPDFVRLLLEREVPEIGDGTVEIKRIVRFAGYRTKMSVISHDPKVDPVGACVGMRGGRVKNVIRELSNEKIDIIPYAADPLELLQNAISPIEIKKVRVDEETGSISIVVDDEDYPVVIGKKGLNARLNGELIERTLEVKKLGEYNRLIAMQQNQLIDPQDNEGLEEIEGLNPLIVEHLKGAGFTTPSSIFKASQQELSKILGVSPEMVDHILEQIRKHKDIDSWPKTSN